MAAYPPYDDYSSIRDINYTDDILVEAVFDPSIQRVTRATQYAGLATAKVGLMATSEEGRLSTSLAILPSDGSSGVTIPIAPGSTLTPPEQLARERDQQPMQFFPVDELWEQSHFQRRALEAQNAPGVTILLLDSTGKALSSRSKENKFVYDDVYHLYGLTGARS